jgi:hypothetical protein
VTGFLARHKQLTVRQGNMIKRSRAAVSQIEVSDFFERLMKSAEGVPPENMYNNDETNLSNNPGAVTAIFRRGVKYTEHARDSTKTCISIMFCGTAAGEMLPPYVVYKASNIYDSWCIGGPKSIVYNSSPSGWFDGCSYTDWFKKVFLPHARRKPGKKLLVVDNLASHISVEVIQLCERYNIAYVCLPPNSTDKIQPLDVGVFGPMKHAWKKQLQAYRQGPRSQAAAQDRVSQNAEGTSGHPKPWPAPAQGV